MDGQSITYDAIGNPTSYFNGTRYSMSWSEGRRLASLTAGGNTTTYTYDLNGLRTKKQNPDGTYIKYFIADGKILGETLYRANNTEVYDMRYTFDENGDVCGISLWRNNSTSWTKYYFLKNLQGDVLAVYQYGDTFTKVAEYTYDSWGNVLTKSGALADINPFRYRSYYQDSETGFYYLQSRYYDPAIGRFLNADVFASTGQDFLGYNMFAYCSSNPITKVDSSGETGMFIFANACIGAICGAVGQITTNVLSGNKNIFEGVLGAMAGGAVYNVVSLTTGNIALASAAGAATEATVNEIALYVTGDKQFNKENIARSCASIALKTAENGLIANCTGKLASNVIKTNKGWFQPKKLVSAFSGKYAQKVWKQTAVQATYVTMYNSAKAISAKLAKGM